MSVWRRLGSNQMIKVAHFKMLHSRQNRLPNPNPFSAVSVDGFLIVLIIWKHSHLAVLSCFGSIGNRSTMLSINSVMEVLFLLTIIEHVFLKFSLKS